MKKIASMVKSILLILIFTILSVSSQAQDKTVSGTVLSDDDATPLIGVSILNKNTNKRTQTNEAGYFSINANNGDLLIFTYVGYVTKQTTVAQSKIINIKLVNNASDLDNVVVTAYGQTRNKRELAYQAPVVKGDEIAQTRRENFINSLAGRVPGLTVTSTSGLPGASAQIILRGGASIAGNNQPLFVEFFCPTY